MPANANSPFLAERLIARLSPLRRGNLARRINERIGDDSESLDYCETSEARALVEWRHDVRCAMLGRLAALT